MITVELTLPLLPGGPPYPAQTWETKIAGFSDMYVEELLDGLLSVIASVGIPLAQRESEDRYSVVCGSFIIGEIKKK